MRRRLQTQHARSLLVGGIDRQDGLLRRLDYPAAALLPEIAQDPAVSELQLWIEMPGAAIGAPIAASRWQLDSPAQAKVVKSFILPPRPLPSKLFGKSPTNSFSPRSTTNG